MFDFIKKKESAEVDEFNIICPKCMEKMEKEIHSDIILDVCRKCGGTWFDKDEVQKLFTFMKSEEEKKKLGIPDDIPTPPAGVVQDTKAPVNQSAQVVNTLASKDSKRKVPVKKAIVRVKKAKAKRKR